MHTDLVPILLGFRDVVRRGRRKIKSTTSGNTTTIQYGYLTDEQFDFACSHVTGLLDRYKQDKKHLAGAVKQVQRKLKKADRSLEAFRDYFSYLDRHRPKKMRKEHGQRVVQLHTQDYTCDWESRITIVRKVQQAAGSFVRSLDHYTNSAVESLNAHNRELAFASDDLRKVQEAMTKDTKILRRYVGIIYRLWRILWAILGQAKDGTF